MRQGLRDTVQKILALGAAEKNTPGISAKYMSKKLNVPHRRIYDVTAVFEALGVVRHLSGEKMFEWNGQGGIRSTLVEMSLTDHLDFIDSIREECACFKRNKDEYLTTRGRKRKRLLNMSLSFRQYAKSCIYVMHVHFPHSTQWTVAKLATAVDDLWHIPKSMRSDSNRRTYDAVNILLASGLMRIVGRNKRYFPTKKVKDYQKYAWTPNGWNEGEEEEEGEEDETLPFPMLDTMIDWSQFDFPFEQ